MREVSYREYWDEIATIISCVRDEVIDFDRDPWDALHEIIGGHAWVIYTALAMDVARISPNDDAWREAGDEFSDETRAFFAMYADVTEHTSWRPDAWEECAPIIREIRELDRNADTDSDDPEELQELLDILEGGAA